MRTPTYIREVDINESDGEFVIACIEKNGSQDVRVRLRELYGQTHVDVRLLRSETTTNGNPQRKA